MTTAPTVDPGPPPPAPAGIPTRSDRFFSFTAGLGVVRGEGWIGGIAAGLAARVKVDPLIVRGILVVLGLFAFPVVFLYGLAWALLPDLDGRIPLQEALRGRFSPAQVGAGLFLLAGLIPSPALFVFGGPGFVFATSGSAWWVAAVFLFVVGLAVAAGLVFLIVRAASRTTGAPDPDLRTASAASEGPNPSAPEPGREPVLAADPRGADAEVVSDPASLPAIDPVTIEPPAAEPVPGESPSAEAPVVEPPADAGDLAEWRAHHAAWKQQDQAWRQQQQDAARAAREQARRERQARATAFAAEAAERRRVRRATSPRTPFAFVATAIGLAVVVGTAVALQQGGALAPAHGLFVATLVLAGAMVLAGFVRRRSGFLAFVTLLGLLGAVGALALPTAQTLHLGDYGLSNTGARFPASAPFVQPFGNLRVTLEDTGGTGETHVEKRNGSTQISVMPGVELTVEVTTDSAAVYVSGSYADAVPLDSLDTATAVVLPDGRTRRTATITSGGGPVTTTERVVIDQDTGFVDVYLFQLDPPAATDTDTDTEGIDG